MFRRSNSSSHIPLRTNLFGHRESGIPAPHGGTLRRTLSASRLSQNDNVTNKKPQRQPSLDRQSSLSRLSKLTPLNKPGKANNTLKTTPGSSTMNQHSYGSRLTQTSARKERKTIQRLASDKKWVAEQFVKVQNFFMDSQLFDISLINNIKPPSINNFIYISSILVKSIFHNVNLNNENYKDLLPKKLKALRYPGKLPNSTLITVNTMNSWPQVIGMWGFLIDKINLSNQNISISEYSDEEERRKNLLPQTCWNFLVERHSLFNTADLNSIKVACDQYVQQLIDIIEDDPQERSKLSKGVLEKEEYMKKLETDINDLLVENAKLESQIKEITKEIAASNESIDVEEAEINEELNTLHKALQRVESRKEEVAVNIETLQEIIKVQSCNYQDKVELLRKIEKLENKIDIIKGKLSHAQKIKNEFDEKLNNERSKLQNKVIEWNRSLVEVSIRKPFLKKLMLRETGFHKVECLNEIKEVVEEKIAVEKEVVENIGRIEAEIKNVFKEIKIIKVEIDNSEYQLDHLNKDIRGKTELKTIVDEDIEKIRLEWEQEKKVLKQEINNIQLNEMIELKTMEMMKSREEVEVLKTETANLDWNIVCFFTDYEEQAEQNIQYMMNIMKDVENQLVKKSKKAAEEKKTRKIILKHIGSLK